MPQDALSGLRFCAIALCATTVAFGLVASANAQIVPDDTLGRERSRVISGVEVRGGAADRINGGAIRGSTLFHSFSEFNVNEGQRVYFASPARIDNILGRVTGRDVSDILGTLGVAGNANLYLLNPNGFVFGRNARLDIRGSFTASTADRFAFGNGRFFSALNPQAPPMLTMNVPIGLQYNRAFGWGWAGHIVNQGNLRVGRNLTFDGGFLNLSGSLQARADLTARAQGNILSNGTFDAGRDLTLQAQGMLHMEEGAGAVAGRSMRLQGNTAINVLLATNPTAPPAPVPQFRSGGNLLLRSDGVVTTDARFSSGGSFAVRTLDGAPGYWVNGQNATVTVAGDYAVGNYEGPSLQVNAGGDITYGRVMIAEIDPAINPNYPVFALNAGGEIRGTGRISSPLSGLVVSLISQENLNLPGRAGLGAQVREAITAPRGLISLVSRRESINDALTNISVNNGDGGVVNFYARQNIENASVNASVDAFVNASIDAFLNSGNGGIVNFYAGQNMQNAAVNASTNASANSGNGGIVSFYAGQNIGDANINASASAFIFASTDTSANSGNGGIVNLYAEETIADVTASAFADASASLSASSGNGGVISFHAEQNIENANANADSSANTNSGNGGVINFYADQNIENANVTADVFAQTGMFTFAEANSGDGGVISFYAGQNMENASASTTVYGEALTDVNGGDGGVISFYAGQNMENASASAFVFVFARADASQSANGGNGGTINFHAGENMDGVSASTFVLVDGNGGDGGTINFYAGESSGIEALSSFSLSRNSESGNGGQINLISRRGGIDGRYVDFNGNIQRATLNSLSIGAEGSGNGGRVNLVAQNNITDLEILTLSSGMQSGNVQIQSPADLLISNVRILTSQQVQIPDPFSPEVNPPITISFGQRGQSGQVDIQSLGRLSIVNTTLESTTRSSQPAGDIFLFSPDHIILRDSQITSDTNALGSAGNITLTAPEIFMDDSEVVAGSNSSLEQGGSGGSITFQNLNLLLLENNSQISTRAFGDANSGILTIDAQNGYIIGIPFENNDIIATAEQGIGGQIDIRAIRIFGFTEQTRTNLNLAELRANTTNDISADSETGTSGTVTFDTLAIDPSQGLVELPSIRIDATQQVARRCGGAIQDGEELGEFIITGRGGLPPTPDDPLGATASSPDLITLNSDTTLSSTPTTVASTATPIIEAQNWTIDPDGQVILTAQEDGNPPATLAPITCTPGS